MRFTKTKLRNAVYGIMKGDCLAEMLKQERKQKDSVCVCVCVREEGQHVLFGLGTCSAAREFDIP